MNGDELENVLISLGFEVRAGKSGKHHIFTHDGLKEFTSSSFDKGHGKQVKSCYTRDTRNILTKYKDALESLLGEKNEQA